MHEARAQTCDGGRKRAQSIEEFYDAEGGKCRGAWKIEHGAGVTLFLGRQIPRRRRVQRAGKLRNVATLKGRDLADALFLYFIHSQHRMQWQVGALDPLELALDALLA